MAPTMALPMPAPGPTTATAILDGTKRWRGLRSTAIRLRIINVDALDPSATTKPVALCRRGDFVVAADRSPREAIFRGGSAGGHCDDRPEGVRGARLRGTEVA